MCGTNLIEIRVAGTYAHCSSSSYKSRRLMLKENNAIEISANVKSACSFHGAAI